MTTYLPSLTKQLNYYRSLAEKTFSQLSDEQLFWHYNSESNNVAMIVKHMAGNMISRWTDFLTTDGEKDWRDRDTEFADDIKDRAAMMKKWNEGWDCVFNALNPLTEADLSRTIHIRGEAMSVVDGCNRQLAHYAYHTGQIAFLGKMMMNEKWNSLSIPKGKSKEFNEKMKNRK